MIPAGAMLFARSWWKAAAGAAVIAGPAFLLGQCSGAHHEHVKAEAARAVAVAEQLQRDGKAKETASAERLKDAAKVADMKEDLTNAVAALPDSLPSARRVALACARLRQQGSDVSRVPACGGPDGRGKAAPRS